MSFIVPKAAEIDTEQEMVDFILSTSKMGLIGTYFAVDPNTTLANCTANEAGFTGYARSDLSTWTDPVIDGDNAAATVATGSFTPTAGGGSGNIYGYFLVDSGGTQFYGCETFTVPLSVPQSVTLAMELTYTALSRY